MREFIAKNVVFEKKSSKSDSEFRNYLNSVRQNTVENHYKAMRKNQTVEFVNRMGKKWSNFNFSKLTVKEAFKLLEGYVDSSDPDSSLPNLEHMLQTAEAIRAAGHPDWLQLTGLIHDMGKIQFLWGDSEDGQEGKADSNQFALGGDTWVVGCSIPDSCVFPEFNKLNPDMENSNYNTKFGVYEANCGMKNLKYAWGHDEYLYQMLLHNKQVSLPEEALYIIRYHSCYPWHSCGEYQHFMVEKDNEILEWVREFNKYDLYTKADSRPDVELLWPYYQGLIDKYMPGKLSW